MSAPADSTSTPTARSTVPPSSVPPARVAVGLAVAGIVVSLRQSPRSAAGGCVGCGATWTVTATPAVPVPAGRSARRHLRQAPHTPAPHRVSCARPVVGAVARSLVPTTAARALQGLAAGVIPLGISVMRDELPVELLGGTAVMSASLGVGRASTARRRRRGRRCLNTSAVPASHTKEKTCTSPSI